ncbi:MAG: hypothetical protein EU533_01175 [Promethearchaeota archaeon]|nr:MAG: hypothetical protein EU533_01175 [Candidatus Lokiarchaeota archaeon]
MSKDDNNSKEGETKDKPIYVKVSDETREIIDKHKELGTSISNLIRDAVKIYDAYSSMSSEVQAIVEKYREKDESVISFLQRVIKYYGELKATDRDIWIRARDEMKMMLIGKTTFNQLIHAAAEPQDALSRPFKRNVAMDLIMWYNDSKPVKTLSIEQIIKTIQKIWVVANYFYTIDVTQIDQKEYHLLFRHRQNKRYSEYWLGYFTELFKSPEMPCQCEIEGVCYDESISITIKARLGN